MQLKDKNVALRLYCCSKGKKDGNRSSKVSKADWSRNSKIRLMLWCINKYPVPTMYITASVLYFGFKMGIIIFPVLEDFVRIPISDCKKNPIM